MFSISEIIFVSLSLYFVKFAAFLDKKILFIILNSKYYKYVQLFHILIVSVHAYTHVRVNCVIFISIIIIYCF